MSASLWHTHTHTGNDVTTWPSQPWHHLLVPPNNFLYKNAAAASVGAVTCRLVCKLIQVTLNKTTTVIMLLLIRAVCVLWLCGPVIYSSSLKCAHVDLLVSLFTLYFILLMKDRPWWQREKICQDAEGKKSGGSRRRYKPDFNPAW